MVNEAESSLFIPTVGLAISTAILVGVTAYYAIQTNKTVKEMKRGNEMQFLPFLLVTYNTILDRSGKLRFKIENMGRGPALEIMVKLSANQKNPKPDHFEYDYLKPGEGNTFDFHVGIQPTSDNTDNYQKAKDYYTKNQTIVNVQLSYNDVLGKGHSASQSAQIKNEMSN